MMFLDMDLSILGVSGSEFDVYDAAVRKEYLFGMRMRGDKAGQLCLEDSRSESQSIIQTCFRVCMSKRQGRKSGVCC